MVDWNVGWVLNTIIIVIFIFATIFLSSLLSNFVTQIGNKTKIPSTILFGVILGVVASLPEFFIAILGVLTFDETNAEGMGQKYYFFELINAGLLSFLLLFFGLLMLRKQLNEIRFSKPVVINSTCIFIMLFSLVVCLFFNPPLAFWITSPLSIVIYATCIYFMCRKKKESAVKEHHFSTNMTKTGVGAQATLSTLIISSVGIIIALIAICFVLIKAVEQVVKYFPENGKLDFTGELILGLVSALPEVVIVINLIKLKNINGLIADILGSLLFTMFTIAIVDFINTDATQNYASGNFAMFSLYTMLIFSLLLLFSLILNKFWKSENRLVVHRIINGILIASVALYFAYVIFIYIVS
ncbi:MAG: hypothetical protein LBS95_00660 [Mycoplasmataceae bacterium]|nr:hypothetical protein [Mycoplasmataceae bacterium]